MKKLYLHIGSPKTGTTSIQHIFYDNRGKLKQQGVQYPGNMGNHHFSFFATKAKRKDWPRQFNSYDENTLSQIQRKYFNGLENDFKANISEQVISTEYLFISDRKYIQNYINYLNNFFEEIKVYLFLRDPVQFFRSSQQQVIKARSFIDNPQEWRLHFRNVIEAWSEFVSVKVIKYEKGKNSCEILCDEIAINYDSLNKPSKESNPSLSVEQMLLLEKVQHHLYQSHEDHFKNHLGVIHQTNTPFTHKPQLCEWVKSVVYNNHKEDLRWLNQEYGINFLQDYTKTEGLQSQPTFENGKATVRDVYKVPSEETVEKYEALVIDALLKKLVQGN